jgi:diguanylate cyclase (GGDEF)-like protein
MNEKSNAYKNITLALVDLDDFKPINDLYGHKMGDYVLQQISWRLASFGQEHRLIARIGGDEFVILQHTPDHNDEEPNPLLTQVSVALGEPISLPNGVTVKLTASIGYACTCSAPRNRSELLKKADEAMYAMKELKNQNVAKVFSSTPCSKEPSLN